MPCFTVAHEAVALAEDQVVAHAERVRVHAQHGAGLVGGLAVLDLGACCRRRSPGSCRAARRRRPTPTWCAWTCRRTAPRRAGREAARSSGRRGRRPRGGGRRRAAPRARRTDQSWVTSRLRAVRPARPTSSSIRSWYAGLTPALPAVARIDWRPRWPSYVPAPSRTCCGGSPRVRARGEGLRPAGPQASGAGLPRSTRRSWLPRPPRGQPAGPAAGPHGQMAQNIRSSWLAGSRVLELKTVQVNDRLTIPRPCIDMDDRGLQRRVEPGAAARAEPARVREGLHADRRVREAAFRGARRTGARTTRSST